MDCIWRLLPVACTSVWLPRRCWRRVSRFASITSLRTLSFPPCTSSLLMPWPPFSTPRRKIFTSSMWRKTPTCQLLFWMSASPCGSQMDRSSTQRSFKSRFTYREYDWLICPRYRLVFKHFTGSLSWSVIHFWLAGDHFSCSYMKLHCGT